jgi:membrane protease YdiL (CAAX protease family)
MERLEMKEPGAFLARLNQGPVTRRVWLYLALTFVLSWLLWLPAIRYKENPVFLNLGGGPAIMAVLMVASGKGEARVWRLWSFLLLVPLLWLILVFSTSWTTGVHWPLDWKPWLLLPSLIPAWIISSAWSGDPRVRSLMKTLVRPPRWQWPAVAFLAFPVFLLTSAAVARHTHLPVIEPARGMSVTALTALCVVRFIHTLTFTAVYEEPGWRGFLLPTLQERFSPLVASIFVWLPWAAWHAPLDFSGGAGSNWALWVQVRLIYFIPVTILLTWLYNQSSGLLSPALFHTAINVFPFLLPYSPPLLGLIFVWAAYVVVSNRMWRRRDCRVGELVPVPAR